MNDPERKEPQIPPEVTRYLRGAGSENLQFDFLIGDWSVRAVRYKPDGSVLLEYNAKWSARYLNDKRMVMDDFKALSPAGDEISSFVTLRTYAEVTRRWEITGLAALQPAMNGEWFGEWKDGEMHMDASGKGPGGQIVRNQIRFFNIEKQSFSWESSMSFDDGKTWVRSSSLIATRAP